MKGRPEERWGLARPTTVPKRQLDSIAAYRAAGMSADALRRLSPTARSMVESIATLSPVEERMLLNTLMRTQSALPAPPAWKMSRFERIPSRNVTRVAGCSRPQHIVGPNPVRTQEW